MACARQTGVKRPTYTVCAGLLFSVVPNGCVPFNFDACAEIDSSETECAMARAAEACFRSVTPVPPLFASQVTLTEIPSALSDVLSRQADFQTANHPLINAPFGTPIGDAEQLQGCWARVQNESFSDGTGEWIEAEAMVIDLAARTLRTEMMHGLEGNLCFSDQRPYIRVFDEMIHGTTETELALEITGDFEDRTTAGVNANGTLGFHLAGRLGWEISVGNIYDKAYVVDGDFLVTSKNREANPDTDRDLWTRVTCPD